MNEVYELLEKLNISYDKVEHEAVYTVKDAENVGKFICGIGCKNLFLKDRNNRCYIYMLKEEKRADFKELSHILQCGRIKFGSEEELYDHLKLKRGSVTPLGILNDNSKVVVILDKELRGHKVLVHPNINNATISLEYEDLLKIIKYCNNSYIEI